MPSPADNLALLQEQVRQAHLRHSAGRSVQGRFANAYQLWRTAYEARAAIAEQNPAFASTLLPGVAPLAGPGLGFFVLPTGIVAQVNNDGTVNLSVDIAGTVTVQVTGPDKSVQQPVVTATPARQSTVFTARLDGLYVVRLTALGTALTTLYVPVQRARMLDFREFSRYLAYAFRRDKTPRATDEYSELLALLYAADAAAATGQPLLYADLAAEAALVPKAPAPVALSYRHAQ